MDYNGLEGNTEGYKAFKDTLSGLIYNLDIKHLFLGFIYCVFRL